MFPFASLSVYITCLCTCIPTSPPQKYIGWGCFQWIKFGGILLQSKFERGPSGLRNLAKMHICLHFVYPYLDVLTSSCIHLHDRFEVDVEDVKYHEFREYDFYKYKESKFDIALLKLAQEVDITFYTPVCLPVLGQDYISPDSQGNWRWGTAAGKGWGGSEVTLNIQP